MASTRLDGPDVGGIAIVAQSARRDVAGGSGYRDSNGCSAHKKVDAGIGQWRFLDGQRALFLAKGELQVWDVETLRPVQKLPVSGQRFQLADTCRTLVVRQEGQVQVYRVLLD